MVTKQFAMVTKQFAMTMTKVEWHLQILQWIHILAVTFTVPITAGFMLTMLENFHYFTLTESLVIEQKHQFAGGRFRDLSW